MEKTNQETSKEEIDVYVLASQIEMLFAFSAQFIPHIDLIERTQDLAHKKESFAHSAAPILMATGLDYDKIAMDTELKRKRADALVNFLRVLRDTEEDRIKFNLRESEIQQNAEQLKQFFRL